MARIWTLPTLLWRVSNVSPSAVFRLRPLSPGVSQLPPAPLGHSQIIQLTTSSTSPHWPLSGAPGGLRIYLQREPFRHVPELWNTYIAAIAGLPLLPELMNNAFDVYDESNALLDLSRAAGNIPISGMHMESCFTQCVKSIRQPNFIVLNKWKNIWVAGFHEKKQ